MMIGQIPWDAAFPAWHSRRWQYPEHRNRGIGERKLSGCTAGQALTRVPSASGWPLCKAWFYTREELQHRAKHDVECQQITS